MRNKLKISAVVIVLFLAGCDKQKVQYPAPVYLGNGGVLIFEAKDQFGNYVFHESLNQYLKSNSTYKVVSITGLDISDSRPQRYLVICEFTDNKPPPNPTTAPTVDDKGEIHYP